MSGTSARLRVALFAAAMLLGAHTVWAGCGCDHPPPLEDVVYPRFGWVGGTIQLTDQLFANPATPYRVTVGGVPVAKFEAQLTPNTLRIVLPAAMPIGPAVIEVKNVAGTVVKRFESNLFTVLPPPFPVVDADGYYYLDDVIGAVDATGTLLVAFDLSKVFEPRQFYMEFTDLPLEFEEDTLVYYNKDQFNLKLFESVVADPAWYQWGRYYGTKVHKAADKKRSDLISYWRHEFYTYRDAHMLNGSHVVGPDGRHPDGTIHVDHYTLVAAVKGLQRDPAQPTDLAKMKPLKPGAVKVDIAVRSLRVEDPVEPAQLTAAQRKLFDMMTVEKFKSDLNTIDRIDRLPAPDRW